MSAVFTANHATISTAKHSAFYSANNSTIMSAVSSTDFSADAVPFVATIVQSQWSALCSTVNYSNWTAIATAF